MKVATVELAGFRAFQDSGPIEFSDSVVIITGRNGAGKTSLLEFIRFHIIMEQLHG